MRLVSPSYQWTFTTYLLPVCLTHHLPHLAFARRCERFPAQRDLRLPRPRTRVEQRLLQQAAGALADLRRLDPKAQLSNRLERTWAVFRRLRSILRLEED